MTLSGLSGDKPCFHFWPLRRMPATERIGLGAKLPSVACQITDAGTIEAAEIWLQWSMWEQWCNVVCVSLVWYSLPQGWHFLSRQGPPANPERFASFPRVSPPSGTNLDLIGTSFAFQLGPGIVVSIFLWRVFLAGRPDGFEGARFVLVFGEDHFSMPCDVSPWRVQRRKRADA